MDFYKKNKILIFLLFFVVIFNLYFLKEYKKTKQSIILLKENERLLSEYSNLKKDFEYNIDNVLLEIKAINIIKKNDFISFSINLNNSNKLNTVFKKIQNINEISIKKSKNILDVKIGVRK